jgi:AcrR family transcriptional regulator
MFMMETEPRPTRRERERQRHRQEILDAALKVVAQRGIDGVTVEQVAKEADFAVGSIYRHFRSKDELVQELFAALSTRFLDDLEAIVRGPGPFGEKLEHVVQFAYDRQIEIQPVLQAFFATPGPLPEPGSPTGDQLSAIKRRHLAAFGSLVGLGQDAGAIGEGDRVSMALALTGLITSYARAEAIYGQAYAGDAAGEVVRIFLGGVGRRL